MDAYDRCLADLRARPRRWLVTGAAGFIGSNLVEALLRLDQHVVGLDSFATGYRRNLDEVAAAVSPGQWSRFSFIEGDIRDPQACARACADVEFVLHQAALGSVPRSIAAPLPTHEANVTGFLNMLVAARDAGVARFVYASSSSVYGDQADPIRREDVLGQPLSPYAASKKADELYAAAFANCYPIACVGLRYFNVFGPRQDPEGAYAAVIPRWVSSLIAGEAVSINGDGETSRDFTHVSNVVQANLLAACGTGAGHEALNVGTGVRTTLNELYTAIREAVVRRLPDARPAQPEQRPFRSGDVRHAVADIARARQLLGYSPSTGLREGLDGVVAWYARGAAR